MLTRFSQLIPFQNNIFHFSTSAKMIRPPPPPPKSPLAKPKANELALSLVARQLNINEESLRKQLLNPKQNYVNSE